jgi:hypothetical protein
MCTWLWRRSETLAKNPIVRLRMITFAQTALLMVGVCCLSCDRVKIQVEEEPVRHTVDLNADYLQYFILETQAKEGFTPIRNASGTVFCRPEKPSLDLSALDVQRVEYLAFPPDGFNLMLRLTGPGFEKLRMFYEEGRDKAVGVVIDGKLVFVDVLRGSASNPWFLGPFPTEEEVQTVRDAIRRGGWPDDQGSPERGK